MQVWPEMKTSADGPASPPTPGGVSLGGEAAGSADVGGALRRVLPETEPNLVIPKRVREALEGAKNFQRQKTICPVASLLWSSRRSLGSHHPGGKDQRFEDCDGVNRSQPGRECSSRPWMVSSTMLMEVSLAEAFHECGGREIQGHLQLDHPRRSMGCRATRSPCKRRQIEEREEQPTPQSWSRSTASLAGSVESQNLGLWRIPLAMKQAVQPGACQS